MPAYAKVFLGFAAYAAIHSLLLTCWVRRALVGLVGPRLFAAFFRLSFVIQATVLLAVFVACAASLPDVEIVRLGGLAAWGLWGVRLAALACIGFCVSRIGTLEFLGVENVRAWRRGEEVREDALDSGPLVVNGSYRFVRHPMYAAGFLVLWADPAWSANRLAFALAASLYLWLGALHEERRLLASFGQSYRTYMGRTPRFIPGTRGGR